MSTSIYHLPTFTVVDVIGKDAPAIVHNVTTNEVKSLENGQGCETFITDVRGKTIGHGFIFRLENGYRFLGAGDQADMLCGHLDKYTIREDAVPGSLAGEFETLIVPPGLPVEPGVPVEPGLPVGILENLESEFGATAYPAPILGGGTAWVLVPEESFEAACGWLGESDITVSDEQHFHSARVAAAFPWYFVDMDDKNLPQELDRDAVAISFTKGCYLGQETVARLDALGQVQRKLVRWSIADHVPVSGTTLDADGKTVGRLTSVVAREGGSIGLGYARRTHFEPDANATGHDEASGQTFTATVVGTFTA